MSQPYFYALIISVMLVPHIESPGIQKEGFLPANSKDLVSFPVYQPVAAVHTQTHTCKLIAHT